MAVALLQDKIHLDEFVLASLPEVDASDLQPYFDHMTKSSSVEYAWVRFHCSSIRRVTAETFEMNFLKPPTTSLVAGAVMQVLSRYFRPGVVAVSLLQVGDLCDWLCLCGCHAQSRARLCQWAHDVE